MLDPTLKNPPLTLGSGRFQRGPSALDATTRQVAQWVLDGPESTWAQFLRADPRRQWEAAPAMRLVAPDDPRLAPWRDVSGGDLSALCPPLNGGRPVLSLAALVLLGLDTDPVDRAAVLDRLDDTDPDLIKHGIHWNQDVATMRLALVVFGPPMLDRMVATSSTTPIATRLSWCVDGSGAVGAMLRLAEDRLSFPPARDWLHAHSAAVAAFDGSVEASSLPVLGDLVREMAAADPSFAPLQPDAARVAEQVRETYALPVLAPDSTA